MDFENHIELLAQYIYLKAYSFVKENKADDDKFYSCAVLSLEDGRQMFFDFNESGKIKIDNTKWNEELQEIIGDYFCFTPNNRFGPLINITLHLDKDDIYFAVSDVEQHNYTEKELTDEVKAAVANYMTQLCEQISSLKYDKEATHSIGNFTYQARRQYNIQQFNNEMKKLVETDPSCKILPSVETAVNWWINMLTGSTLGGSLGNGNDINAVLIMALAEQEFQKTSITKNQIALFKELLSTSIMDRLSQGLEVLLDVDYAPSGIFAEAINKSGISGSKAPLKTIMRVNVDSVKVSVGYGAKYEEIFNNSTQEEIKPKSKK